MTTRQQQETLEYFRRHAEDWRAGSVESGNVKVNVIDHRNAYVLRVAEERPATRSFLDVGCGPGELVCRMARRGVPATGLDFAPEMIDLARKKVQDERISRATFVCCSIFDFPMKRESYDLISANGFIEYISPQAMQSFFDLVAEALTLDGSFVVGSRNRLFNLLSMNEYTLAELRAGAVELLLREAVKWTTANGIVEVWEAECAPLQPPDTLHPQTGIEVRTRFQYSPFQLINLLQSRGLRAVDVYPVHIHGVPPAFKEDHAEVHASIANLLQAHATHNTQLLAHASTFMLHVRKAR
jgi:2-polyprenyl-3-methyl-5-hydroxy-6-metoxy-1,4-benzoquinol methylase